ncbi:type II secretion system protein GspG [Rhodococcus sp. SRB_17]|uniref:type II secretion system major pseudopilin GspG n=1 Tax=Acidovorax sp. SRB_24 TaxID=1962700 RepID=UPI00145CC7CF|nr:type II secretion system major pseudopilin GspG [Acidovorax sp. SRB_24]NMM77908.1 type II secretion system protein GspG [Acidovorax sp. SRB_24]NMM89727.1 type II secretion system protein GspG [Rhodococcus sp. SRB_17]
MIQIRSPKNQKITPVWRHRGFTLLEMLVVMVIIGLLAGLVGPRIFGKVDSSKVQTAQVQIKMIESALQIMRLDVGTLPDGETALHWLVREPEDPSVRAVWKGPYMDGQIPVDPWNNPYKIVTPGPEGKSFAVTSYGADGKPGGEGLNADIMGK